MDMPPETSMRWALTQRLSSESSDAIIGVTRERNALTRG
jgi:hypothetical protein